MLVDTTRHVFNLEKEKSTSVAAARFDDEFQPRQTGRQGKGFFGYFLSRERKYHPDDKEGGRGLVKK